MLFCSLGYVIMSGRKISPFIGICYPDVSNGGYAIRM